MSTHHWLRACLRFVVRPSVLVLAVAACGGGGDTVTPPPAPPPPPPAVASVAVTPSSAPLLIGQSTTLSATTRDAAGATLNGRSITWNSETPQVASVDANGRVTGVSAGLATITASSEGRQGSATLTVSAPLPTPVASVSVSSPAGPLVPRQTLALSATARDSSNNVLTGRAVAWSSATPTVVSVNTDGLVTAHAAGTAVITATSEGRTGTATITVGAGGMIDASGGTITAGAGAITIDIPAGALAANTPISVTRNDTPPTHPGLLPGSAWDIGPVGTTFATPATVTLRYDASALPANTSPLRFSVRRRGTATWDVLSGGELRLTPPSVSARTTASGTFAIVSPGTFDVASGTFEGSAQGWTPSGNESVVASVSAARSGNGGLLVTNRSASWQGAGLSVLATATPGAFFKYEVWVRLAPNESPSTLGLTMEWRAPGITTSKFEPIVGSTPVTRDGWTKLEGTYALPSTATFARIKVASSTGTTSYLLDDFSLVRTETPIQQNIPALKTVMAPYFKMGSGADPGMVDTPHGALILRHFNSITPGNDLKWEVLQPTEGQFNFASADRLVDFATQNGLQVRGHTFVWHNQVPAWVFRDAQGQPLTASPAHKALLLARMETHIRTVARRYGNKIAVWDVVNEVIDPNQPDGYRRSPWFNVIGPEFIERAFRVAREELPNAKLVINDYQTEQPAKREALYRLVAQLKAQGVPVDGVGHQMHNSLTRPTLTQIEAAIQRFIPLGVDQEITELDITLYDDLNTFWTVPPADRLVRQGELYRDLFTLLRRYAANISTVTVWGPSDDNSWLNYAFVVRSDWPLLFDRQLQGKPAYWGIVDPAYITASPLWLRASNTPFGSTSRR